MFIETEWIDSQVFFTHNGTTIRHVYKNDDIDNRLVFWYEVDGQLFDVRTVPGFVDVPRKYSEHQRSARVK